MSGILVVEPGSTARRLLEYVLVSAGFDVSTATDLAQARRAIDASVPTVAFCEVDLTDGSGLDLVADLRVAGTSHVVMLSTRTRPQDQEQALAAGADELMGKPLSPARLRAVADAHMRVST
jgi:two-component system, OmpR family, phosphate regulon response regulator PhoB